MNKFSSAYQEYMQSPEWQSKRSNRLKIDNYQCQKCGRPMDLEVHHLTYDNFGNENVYTDLITLCKSCHGDVERAKNVFRNLMCASSENNARLLAREFCETHEHLDYSRKGDFNLCELNTIKVKLKEFYENRGLEFDANCCNASLVQRYFRNKRYEVIMALREKGAENDYILSQYKFSVKMVTKSTEAIKVMLKEEF